MKIGYVKSTYEHLNINEQPINYEKELAFYAEPVFSNGNHGIRIVR